MSHTLSHKDGVVAKKSHVCCFCHESIIPGHKYDRRSGVDCGDMWTMHMHPECHAKERETPYSKREDWYYDMSEPVFERPLCSERKGGAK